MKKVVLMLCAVAAISFTSCKNNDKASDKMTDKESTSKEVAKQDEMAKEYPEMTFDETSFDFGTIKEGDVVSHEFSFTNTGDAPLKITKAKGSCGCTIPSYSKHPIAPGDTGKMMVKFNSRGKKNNQNKSVRITTNTKSGQEMIRIKAMVTPTPKKNS